LDDVAPKLERPRVPLVTGHALREVLRIALGLGHDDYERDVRPLRPSSGGSPRPSRRLSRRRDV
jgi:hypothetical protein